MRRAVLVAALIALVCSATPARAAADPEGAGTDFWLGFPDVLDEGTPSYELLITATTAANGSVSIPGTAFSQAFTTTPGSVTTVGLPATVEHEASDAVQTGRGIHVAADHAVVVRALYLNAAGLSDGYLGLPTDMLSTNYRVLAYPGSLCGLSQFEIVGTQAGTTVTVHSDVSIGGHAAGVTYAVPLNAGSTYLGQSSSASSTSGTEITADKPIAVLGGHSCGQVPVGTAAANLLVEEMPPVSAWGIDFSVETFAGRTAGDELTLLGSQDGTSLTIKDAEGTPPGSPLSLNAGQAVSFFIDESTRITADKPILVAHFAQGLESDSPDLAHITGDPTMVLVPPREHYAHTQTVTTPPTGFASRYINVMISTADLGSLKLDGAVVSAASFQPVGGDAAVSAAQLPISAGAHTLTDDGPFGVEVYGFDPSADAFGWPGAWGDGSRAPVPAPPGTPPPPPAGASTKKPAFGEVVRLPSTKRCLPRTGVTVRLRAPKGDKIVKAVIRVNGRKITVTGRKLAAPIRLPKLPTGRVKIVVTVTLAVNGTIRGSKTYRTCGKGSRR
jgi:hypothetical protein